LASPYSKLEKWQRMYVNRSLNMERIKAIGFDMDHTLVMYNREEFESLAFRETLKKFIEAGYPEELADLQFKPNFLIRGLLVDMERGNLLKVDGHKYVKTAFHGSTSLDKETRHRLYNSESFKAQEFLSVDTFFSLSEVQLFVEIVVYMDQNPKKINKTYREVYGDLRRFIDLSHADGSIKNVVMADPGRFIRKDKYLSTALTRLIDGGKNLFLLTNSGWDYTNRMMSYILDNEHDEFPSWRDYFDVTIVSSGKPGFFTGSQPFLEVMTESGLLKPHSSSLLPKRVYQGGNASLFQKLTKYRGDEILYVGDHIFGDIMQSKGKLNWRTLLVVEELEHELERLAEIKPLFHEIQQKINEREALDEEIQIVRSKLMSIKRHIQVAGRDGDTKKAHHLEKERDKYAEKITGKTPILDKLDNDIKELLTRKESSLHATWGELMKVGLERSRFAYQVEGFACIYTSRVSNLRFYSPQKRFSSFHDILPHDP
jgi:HAD superfamily 5'-nucleotidase-like hydrolase